MQLKRIRIYPIKCLEGLELERSGFTSAGALEFDRRWCLLYGETEIISKIEVVVRAPGFIGRRQTNTLRSDAEQKSDFDATDTFFSGVTEVVTVQREWGQRSG